MRNECNIIKDLLPLYVENMVCEDTIYFIEEHISTCEKCRNKLKSMESLNMLDENTKETINDDIIYLTGVTDDEASINTQFARDTVVEETATEDE